MVTARSSADFVLSVRRNRLTDMINRLTMACLATSYCAIVGSFFGMNLPHGLEEKPIVFWGIMGTSLLSALGLYCYGSHLMNTNLKGWYRKDHDVFHNAKLLESVLHKMPQIETGLHSAGTLTGQGGFLGPVDFKDHLTQYGLSVEEAQYVFKLLDRDNDGQVSRSDFTIDSQRRSFS